MAKAKPSLSGLIRRTEPSTEGLRPASKQVSGMDPGVHDKTAVVSVGLKQSEIALLAEIASENGVTRNNLMAYALRCFIKDYSAGKVNLARAITTLKRL